MDLDLDLNLDLDLELYLELDLDLDFNILNVVMPSLLDHWRGSRLHSHQHRARHPHYNFG